jgi:hypothetical protein
LVKQPAKLHFGQTGQSPDDLKLGEYFPMSRIIKLPREISDHNPLILETVPDKVTKHFTFQFEIGWLYHPDFRDNIRRIWEKTCGARNTLDKVHQKLKFFKQFLKRPDWNNKGERKKYIESSRF